MASFRLSGLDHRQFLHLFDQSSAELASQGIVRKRASAPIGFPCRASLVDAAEGEELLLLPYAHHRVTSPYRASGPIYIRRGAIQAQLPPGLVPDYVTRRLISIRAYDDAHMLVDAAACEGIEVSRQLQAAFDDPTVAYIHLHNAKPGCYSCLASRVD